MMNKFLPNLNDLDPVSKLGKLVDRSKPREPLAKPKEEVGEVMHFLVDKDKAHSGNLVQLEVAPKVGNPISILKKFKGEPLVGEKKILPKIDIHWHRIIDNEMLKNSICIEDFAKTSVQVNPHVAVGYYAEQQLQETAVKGESGVAKLKKISGGDWVLVENGSFQVESPQPPKT